MDTLAHGTSLPTAMKAIRHGILPRASTKVKSKWAARSSKQCVYLSSSYAFHYAKNACGNSERCAIVEVDMNMLNPACMMSDEDTIQQVETYKGDFLIDQSAFLKARGDISKIKAVRERCEYISNHLDNYFLEGYTGSWSLRLLGNMAYKGHVMPLSIKRVVTIDNCYAAEMYALFDPTITIRNFAVLGDFYINFQKLLLDRDYNRHALAPFKPHQVSLMDRLEDFLRDNRIVVYDRDA